MEIISVGQHAEGIFAFGQFATGVVAVGQVATGIIAIGQVARGVVCVGQVSISLGWGLGMLSVSPGKAIGMLALGGRGVGLLGISVLPKPRQYLPGVDVTPAARLLAGTLREAWIAVRLDRDGMGRLVGREKGLEVPLEIPDPATRDRANDLLTSGTRDVLIRVGATVSVAERTEPNAGAYRVAPAQTRVLQGLQVEPLPPLPPMTAGMIASWIVRLLIVAGLAIGWWAAAGQALAEAFGIIDG
ncbi:MAG: hypothetical protein WCJ30_00145 [Deltaproteobacteria bacterium]